MTLQDMNDSSDGQAGARKALGDRRPKKSDAERAQADAIAELVRAARANGDPIAGPQGLLKQLTKLVLESSLEEEMTEHLGHAKHQADDPDDDAGNDHQQGRNVRNGSRTKTVLTDAAGKVDVTVPRDRAGTFEPVIVPKHHRKLGSVDTMVLSLTAKGLTTGEISAHLEEIYGASVSKDTISRITDRIGEEMNDWLSRPLDPVYAAIFVDAIVVKVRDGSKLSLTLRSLAPGSPTGRSTLRSASLSRAAKTSWACGPAPPAKEKERSTGLRS